MDRRRFLGGACLALAGAGVPVLAGDGARAWAEGDWGEVRALFDLDPRLTHLGGLLIASHPRPVREAIERHRAGLDRDPAGYVFEHDTKERVRAVEQAGAYFDTSERNVALTDSTTMGLSLLYHGIKLGPGDEILRTEHDHYSTWYSLDLKAAASGASVRAVRLHEGSPAEVREEELVERLVAAVGPKTKVLAVTWVHSSTGLKLPLAAIDAELRRRGLREELLFCVDGVHGFGVEDAGLGDLGCDFFVAGCHKWLLGPRGTGVVYAARPELWEEIAPVIPPFGVKHTEGLFHSPGGFHAFEHRWALGDAFAFQLNLGKGRVAERLHGLAGRLKEGLARRPGVELQTPLAPQLSAGIVAFDLRGQQAERVVERLREEHGIVVTQSPYGSRSVRVSPGIFNTPEEIDRLLDAIGRLERT